MDVAAIQVELGQLLGVRVDVLTPNALPAGFRQDVLRQAVPVWKVVERDLPQLRNLLAAGLGYPAFAATLAVFALMVRKPPLWG